MARILFDFKCKTCDTVFEELVDTASTDKVQCLHCGSVKTERQLSALRIDPKLGIDASFSTMSDKWERKQRQRARIEAKRTSHD